MKKCTMITYHCVNKFTQVFRSSIKTCRLLTAKRVTSVSRMPMRMGTTVSLRKRLDDSVVEYNAKI